MTGSATPLPADAVVGSDESDDAPQITLYAWVGIASTEHEGYVTGIRDEQDVTLRTVDHREYTVPIDLVEPRDEPGLPEAAAAVIEQLREYFTDLETVVEPDELGLYLARLVLETTRAAAPGRR